MLCLFWVWNLSGGSTYFIVQRRPMLATSMESSRQALSNDMAEHQLIWKNNQNTHCPRLSFTPETGIAFPKTSVLFLLNTLSSEYGNGRCKQLSKKRTTCERSYANNFPSCCRFYIWPDPETFTGTMATNCATARKILTNTKYACGFSL